MMKKIVLCCLIAAPVVVAGCTQAERVGPQQATPCSAVDGMPMGGLGYPIGTYLTVEGVRAEGFKTGARTLAVDTLNGRKLDQPIGIWVDNVDSLPKGTRCVLKGYESARWIGTPPEVEAATGIIGQARWQLYRYFVATSADRPTTIELLP